MTEEIILAYNKAMEKNAHILEGLNKTLHSAKIHVEGNLFYFDHEFWENPAFAEPFALKRYNLFDAAKKAQNIVEIGFNGGHSCFLMLIANPISKIQVFDLGLHSYVKLCYEYLSQQFPGRLSMILGDSAQTVKLYNPLHAKCDLIHIDGSHEIGGLVSDVLNCRKFSDKNTLVIIDDYEVEPLKSTTDIFVGANFLQLVPQPFDTTSHIYTKYGLM